MRERAGRRALAGFALLGAGLFLLMVWPYLVDGHRFGVGPDVPVYLWWTRVGAGEGLSLLGSRPGAPGLAAALGGTLNLSAAGVTAALPAALGVATGTAAAALVRSAGGRPEAAWLAALLAGVFSVHLVAGYLANLVFAVAFLSSAACLAGERRSWGPAALLLAGGGLAHPAFLVHGILILVVVAALAWRAPACSPRSPVRVRCRSRPRRTATSAASASATNSSVPTASGSGCARRGTCSGSRSRSRSSAS